MKWYAHAFIASVSCVFPYLCPAMRKYILFLLFFFSLFAVHSYGQGRPRVALVLSGGGAKGAAHLGVIRALEEAHVPIDYIVGTSMGAVVGGLYAMGYTTEELETLFRTTDWDLLMSDRAPRKELSPTQRERQEIYVLSVPLAKAKRPELNGLVRGRNLGNMLAQLTVGYHDSISFDSLRIPFACVATNLATGEEEVLRSGTLSTAIRASMSFPGALSPVRREGKTLVDGGMTNNFPVDVAQSMGADIVIGVTVQRPMPDSLETADLQSVVQQLVSISSRRKFEENVRRCDLCLMINTDGVSTMDFTPTAIDTMIRRGYEAAQAHLSKIQTIARQAQADSISTSAQFVLQTEETSKEQHAPHSLAEAYAIREVFFDSVTVAEERIIRQACGLKNFSTISQKQIDKAVRLLGERFLYQDANFSLTPIGTQYDLTLHAHQRLTSQIGVAGRFDTEELATLLLNAHFVFHTRVPFSIETTARLSEQYGARAGLTLEPRLNHQLGIYYAYRHHDMDVYSGGHRAYNLVFQEHKAGFAYAYHQARNFDMEFGVQALYYALDDILADMSQTNSAKPHSDLYFSAYARLIYNSQDRLAFPTRGSKAFAEYSYTTSNLGHLQKPYAFSAVDASWEKVFPLAKRFYFVPRLSGRILLGEDIPYVFINTVGGSMRGKYLAQQLPFVGINHIEPVRNALLMADVKVHYNFLKRQYATLLAAVMGQQRNLKTFRTAHYDLGIGVGYAYNTKFGPISAQFSYSTTTHRPALFLNVGYDF